MEQSEDATATDTRRRRLTRAERSPDARRHIFDVAARVVGMYGYAAASISRITKAAGMAQGTFYLYFSSRQSLFEELLPHAGAAMLSFVRDRIGGSRKLYEAEERGFRAFFEYLEDNPGFIRLLNEAEAAAPAAHTAHFRMLGQRYLQALDHARAQGEIQNFDTEELEAIAYMLMAARSYLHLRYLKDGDGKQKLPEKVVQAYMKLIRGGLR